MKVHDVTVVLRPDMPTWPGQAGPTLEPLRRISRGDSSNVSILSLGDHTGTHVDPPLHFIDSGADVSALPIAALLGPCRVVAYEGEGHITAEWLSRARIPEGTERILFKTRNSARWASNAAFDESFVAIERTGAEWLVQQGLRLVGIDYLSIEPFGSGKIGHPVHHTLLGAEIVVVEGLDLSAVEPGAYDLVCAPLRIAGGDGSPARVLLVERGG